MSLLQSQSVVSCLSSAIESVEVGGPAYRTLVRVVEDHETGCWNFQGAKNEFGYGIVGLGVKGKNDRAHRVVYRALVGDTPAGMFVCHKCDNPSCCNPDHLFIGTPADNHKDMVAKSRDVKPPRNEHDIGSHRYNAKLDEEMVRALRARYDAGESGYSIWKELNQKLGFHQAPVYRMLQRKAWRHV